MLKMKTSRMVFSEIVKECGTMAFNLSYLSDLKKAKMGLLECVSHSLVVPYTVWQDKEEGAEMASVVVTVLLMPNGPLVLCPEVLIESGVKSEIVLQDEETLKMLAEPYRAVKKKAAVPKVE